MTRKDARSHILAAYNDPRRQIFGMVVGDDGQAEVRYFDKQSRLLAADPQLFDHTVYAVPVPSEQPFIAGLPHDEPLFAILGNTVSIKAELHRAGLRFERVIAVDPRFSRENVREGWIGTYSQVSSVMNNLTIGMLI